MTCIQFTGICLFFLLICSLVQYGLKLRENFELSQRRQMVINRMFTSRSLASGELRSPPLSRGGTIKLIPIVRADDEEVDGEEGTDSQPPTLELQDPPRGHRREENSTAAAAQSPTSATSASSAPTCQVEAATPMEEESPYSTGPSLNGKMMLSKSRGSSVIQILEMINFVTCPFRTG